MITRVRASVLYARFSAHRVRMRITVGCLAIGDAYRKNTAPCIESHVAYCRDNGYMYVTDDSVYDASRPPSWSKLLLAKKYLPTCDYFMWVDADTIITNNDARIEDFIGLMGDRPLLIGRDFNDLNCGVIIMRNTPDVFAFLDRVWARTEYIHDTWWENRAIVKIYTEDVAVRDMVRVIPTEHVYLLNAYHHNHSDASLLIHFAGVGATRIQPEVQRFKHMANRRNRAAFESKLRDLQSGDRLTGTYNGA